MSGATHSTTAATAAEIEMASRSAYSHRPSRACRRSPLDPRCDAKTRRMVSARALLRASRRPPRAPIQNHDAPGVTRGQVQIVRDGGPPAALGGSARAAACKWLPGASDRETWWARRAAACGAAAPPRGQDHPLALPPLSVRKSRPRTPRAGRLHRPLHTLQSSGDSNKPSQCGVRPIRTTCSAVNGNSILRLCGRKQTSRAKARRRQRDTSVPAYSQRPE